MTNNINLQKTNENTEEKGVFTKLKNVTSGVVKTGTFMKTLAVGVAHGVSNEIQKSKMTKEEQEQQAKILREKRVASNMNGVVRNIKNEVRNAANVGYATFFLNEEENDVNQDPLLKESDLTKNHDTGMGFYELKRTIEGYSFQVIFESFETVVIDDKGQNADRFLVMPNGEPVNARDVHEPRSVLQLYARDNRDIPNAEKLLGGDQFLLGYGDNRMKTHPLLKKELIASGKQDEINKLFDLFYRSMGDLKAETSTRLFRNPDDVRKEEERMLLIREEERRKADAERIAAEKEQQDAKQALLIKSAVQDVLKEYNPPSQQPIVQQQQQPIVQPQSIVQQQTVVQPQYQPIVENSVVDNTMTKFVTVTVNNQVFSEGSIYVDSANAIINQVPQNNAVVVIDGDRFINGMINIQDNVVYKNGVPIGRAVLPSMLRNPMSSDTTYEVGQLAQ